jgi:NAD(P)-dependent dehydrogenase (short-subunit alcohol dehydrogenase family)
MRVSGLVGVVTGAASGIGLATANLLLDEGARAVAALDLGDPPARDGLIAVRADVTDDATLRAAAATVARELGGADILVCNAGIGATGTVEDNDDDEWRRVFEVNVFGMVRTVRAFLPLLRESAAPAIVTMGSIVSTTGLPQRACYGASKGAVLALSKAMAADLAADGIRVNCVCPGTVDTPWVGRLLDATDDPAATRQALVARQPIGRLGTAEEIAEAVVYLASPAAGYVTGSAFAIDGGIAGVRVPPPTA